MSTAEVEEALAAAEKATNLAADKVAVQAAHTALEAAKNAKK